MTVSRELIKKYSIAGPRYTSYPTVPHWKTSPTEKQWISSLANALESAEARNVGAALYIHIPFCESLCTFCGCNTRITRNHQVSQPYVRALLKEWENYLSKLSRFNSNRPVQLSEIYLGGGTPTFLSVPELQHLLEGILSQVEISGLPSSVAEVDPRVTSLEQLQLLFRLGFRQLNVGLQDFDPVVQQVVNRIQSEDQVRRITEQARELGFTSINYELIYGLPFQMPKSILNTFEAIERLRPDRIAFYSYSHVPWIKTAQRQFSEEDLPSTEEKQLLYEVGRESLEALGYRELGMDHFVLKSNSLWKAAQNNRLQRNFMGYREGEVLPLMGLGVSAMGDSWTVLSQNEKLLETYQSRVESGELPIFRGQVLSSQELMVRGHISNLIHSMGTNWTPEFFERPLFLSVNEKLKEFENDGLVLLSRDFCQITDTGKPFLKNICKAFDLYY